MIALQYFFYESDACCKGLFILNVNINVCVKFSIVPIMMRVQRIGLNLFSALVFPKTMLTLMLTLTHAQTLTLRVNKALDTYVCSIPYYSRLDSN